MRFKQEKKCRACKREGTEPILSLGETPLADRLLSRDQLGRTEITAPLDLVFCPGCSLVQLSVTIPPEILFKENYPYYSSVSESYLRHAARNAEELAASLPLDSRSLVIEIACNDGYMLRNFTRLGIPVIGIDPAEGPVAAARQEGIPVISEFFGRDLALTLRDQGVSADLVIANNVLAHVPDLEGFVEGIGIIMRDSGTAVIEVPYLDDLISNNEFDTIYHQHLCYFSLASLHRLFSGKGLFINEVRRIPVHGGSLRLHVGHREEAGKSVGELLEAEKMAGLAERTAYMNFAGRVARTRESLSALLAGLRGQGKRIAGYGAAAKATTLLSCCGIDSTILDFIVDLNSRKHGLFMGGNHLPVFPVEKLLAEKPDYTLLLSWNLSREIISQQRQYLREGGRFIIPIPEPEILPGPLAAAPPGEKHLPAKELS